MNTVCKVCVNECMLRVVCVCVELLENYKKKLNTIMNSTKSVELVFQRNGKKIVKERERHREKKPRCFNKITVEYGTTKKNAINLTY